MGPQSSFGPVHLLLRRLDDPVLATDLGRMRHSNEDALGFDNRFAIAAVADGVGSGSGGGRAARLAIQTVLRSIPAECAALGTPSTWKVETSKQVLAGALLRVQARIWSDSRSLNLPKMATTLTVVWCVGGFAVIGHIGDSRAYRLRNGRLEQLTTDHTQLEELRRTYGEVTADMKRMYEHVLCRAFSGRREWVEPDIRVEPLEAGDVFLLCTDGLTRGVDEKEIAAVFGDVELTAVPGLLVDLANAAGGQDNVTAVVARVG
ncbi:MAG: serine/threonine-protein phosphatase [Polyangiaceae bacterium]|nr:serine/threonine-protein phosphatase [Polyangiaceae bacterium]